MIDPNEITTVRVDQLPPDSLHLTDLFPFETADQFLKKATIAELVAFIALQTSALQFEVKEMMVNQAYIDDNFDETGLGINICAGFAICNGQNGTENLDGLVTIGYGTNYSSVGGFGGSKDAVVVEHSHGIKYGNNGTGTSYPEDPYISSVLGGDMYGTEITGVSGVNKNMQPYVIHLKMMKL